MKFRLISINQLHEICNIMLLTMNLGIVDHSNITDIDKHCLDKKKHVQFVIIFQKCPKTGDIFRGFKHYFNSVKNWDLTPFKIRKV